MSSQIDLIKKYGLAIRGHAGQHILADPNIARKIVDLLGLEPSDRILEIGPGLGALTRKILQKPVCLTAVEKDERFVRILEIETDPLKHPRANFDLRRGNFLKWDMESWLREFQKSKKNKKIKVISNLPYYITTPILFKLIENRQNISRAVLMMQREVAKRLAAQPGSKDYGRLSLAVQYAAGVRHEFDVPLSCFTPQPDVQSSVMVLEFEGVKERLEKRSEKFLFHLIRLAFGQRRKTLIHLLLRDPETRSPRPVLENILGSLGFREDVRGEQLSLDEFVALSSALQSKRIPAKSRKKIAEG